MRWTNGLTCAAYLVSAAACANRSADDTARDVPAAASQVAKGADSATAPLQADRDSIVFVPRAALQHAADNLATGNSTASVLLNRAGVQFIEARRVVTGAAEIHDDWGDVTVVQAGRATLLSGGRVPGSQLRSAGEHRGPAITGGARQALEAGDLFYVPPGVPHQYVLAPRDSIRYLTIKVPRVSRASGRTSP